MVSSPGCIVGKCVCVCVCCVTQNRGGGGLKRVEKSGRRSQARHFCLWIIVKYREGVMGQSNMVDGEGKELGEAFDGTNSSRGERFRVQSRLETPSRRVREAVEGKKSACRGAGFEVRRVIVRKRFRFVKEGNLREES